MKKLILFSFFSLVSFTSIFSQVNIKENIDISNFPTIEFIIHNRNPEVLESSNFSFFELIDNQEIKSDSFDIQPIKDTSDFSNKNKCVLILLETLRHPDRIE